MYSSCVHPKKPIAIEIIEHTGAAVLGFSGHVRDVDFVSMVLWVYFRTQSDVQLEIIAMRHRIAVLQRKTPKLKLKAADRRLWVWLSECWPRRRQSRIYFSGNAFGILARPMVIRGFRNS
jgi:hypothetical protein